MISPISPLHVSEPPLHQRSGHRAPCIAGSSAGAPRLEKLAIAQVRQVHHLGRISSTFFIDAALDAKQNSTALVERSAVGATGSLSSTDICLPELSLFLPETLVREIGI